MPKLYSQSMRKKNFVKQCGNREWASLIKAIGLRQQLPMWCIFKGKKYIDKWYNALEPSEGHEISLSENR